MPPLSFYIRRFGYLNMLCAGMVDTGKIIGFPISKFFSWPKNQAAQY